MTRGMSRSKSTESSGAASTIFSGLFGIRAKTGESLELEEDETVGTECELMDMEEISSAKGQPDSDYRYL